METYINENNTPPINFSSILLSQVFTSQAAQKKYSINDEDGLKSTDII